MVASENDIMGTMRHALAKMDLALGRKVSAMVISGAVTPPRRGVRTQESPQFLTSRALVTPMVRTLGYTDVTEMRRELEHIPGLVIAVTAANHPLREASENLLRTMRAEDIGFGVATDGIRWMMAEMYGKRPKIVCMSDLRPCRTTSRFSTATGSGPPCPRTDGTSACSRACSRRYRDVKASARTADRPGSRCPCP